MTVYGKSHERKPRHYGGFHDSPCNMSAVQTAIREGYAWPGGYEFYGILQDGDILCTRCMKKEYKQIARDTRYGFGSWWVRDIICTQNDEHDLQCSHCYMFLVTCWKATQTWQLGNDDETPKCEEGCLMVYPMELLP